MLILKFIFDYNNLEYFRAYMSKELKSWLLLLLLSCIWGSSFILMNKGLYASDKTPVFSYEQVGALRMLIASITLSPFAFYNLRKVTNYKLLFGLLIVGFSGNFIPAFLFPFAQTGLSSGYAGMLNSFTPIFTVLLGFIIYGIKLTQHQMIGMFIGTIGIVLLMLAGKQLSISGEWIHIFAIVTATLLYALSINTIKNSLQSLKAIEISSLAFLFLLIPSATAIYFTGTIETLKYNQHAGESLIYISILSIFGTTMAVLLFNVIIKNSSAIFASSVTYFIPVVAVIIGFFFEEKISWLQVGAMCVVLVGVFIINRGDQLIARYRNKNNLLKSNDS